MNTPVVAQPDGDGQLRVRPVDVLEDVDGLCKYFYLQSFYFHFVPPEL